MNNCVIMSGDNLENSCGHCLSQGSYLGDPLRAMRWLQIGCPADIDPDL